MTAREALKIYDAEVNRQYSTGKMPDPEKAMAKVLEAANHANVAVDAAFADKLAAADEARDKALAKLEAAESALRELVEAGIKYVATVKDYKPGDRHDLFLAALNQADAILPPKISHPGNTDDPHYVPPKESQ